MWKIWKKQAVSVKNIKKQAVSVKNIKKIKQLVWKFLKIDLWEKYEKNKVKVVWKYEKSVRQIVWKIWNKIIFCEKYFKKNNSVCEKCKQKSGCVKKVRQIVWKIWKKSGCVKNMKETKQTVWKYEKNQDRVCKKCGEKKSS